MYIYIYMRFFELFNWFTMIFTWATFSHQIAKAIGRAVGVLTSSTAELFALRELLLPVLFFPFIVLLLVFLFLPLFCRFSCSFLRLPPNFCFRSALL